MVFPDSNFTKIPKQEGTRDDTQIKRCPTSLSSVSSPQAPLVAPLRAVRARLLLPWHHLWVTAKQVLHTVRTQILLKVLNTQENTTCKSIFHCSFAFLWTQTECLKCHMSQPFIRVLPVSFLSLASLVLLAAGRSSELPAAICSLSLFLSGGRAMAS